MAQQDTMTGAEILLKALTDQGVEVIFGYPGGAVLPIYDELFKQNRLRHVLVRHEQAAVHAAEGYACSTGKVGCVLVTSGPGATNTVTGLADALMDSIPIVCITGQVPTHLIGNDAFQEADITGITRPCTKHNYLVKDTNLLARTVHEAFHVARSGRPGPVLIDLPKDVVQAHGEYQPPAKVKSKYNPQVKGDLQAIEQAVELIAKARRPVFPVTLRGTLAEAGTIMVSGPGQKWRARSWKREDTYLASSSAMKTPLINSGRERWISRPFAAKTRPTAFRFSGSATSTYSASVGMAITSPRRM